jgi:acetyl-CoA carboxylase carboxyl transferase subunit beta
LLTKSPAVEVAPKETSVINAAQIVSAAESAPAAPHA